MQANVYMHECTHRSQRSTSGINSQVPSPLFLRQGLSPWSGLGRVTSEPQYSPASASTVLGLPVAFIGVQGPKASPCKCCIYRTISFAPDSEIFCLSLSSVTFCFVLADISPLYFLGKLTDYTETLLFTSGVLRYFSATCLDIATTVIPLNLVHVPLFFHL